MYNIMCTFFYKYSNNEVQINMKYEVAIIGIKSPSFFVSYTTFLKDLLVVPKILESFGILGNCCQRCNPFFTCEFRTLLVLLHYGPFSCKKVKRILDIITSQKFDFFIFLNWSAFLIHKQPTVFWKKTATPNWIYQIQISKSKTSKYRYIFLIPRDKIGTKQRQVFYQIVEVSLGGENEEIKSATFCN